MLWCYNYKNSNELKCVTVYFCLARILHSSLFTWTFQNQRFLSFHRQKWLMLTASPAKAWKFMWVAPLSFSICIFCMESHVCISLGNISACNICWSICVSQKSILTKTFYHQRLYSICALCQKPAQISVYSKVEVHFHYKVWYAIVSCPHDMFTAVTAKCH